jgi:hypothetical protein
MFPSVVSFIRFFSECPVGNLNESVPTTRFFSPNDKWERAFTCIGQHRGVQKFKRGGQRTYRGFQEMQSFLTGQHLGNPLGTARSYELATSDLEDDNREPSRYFLKYSVEIS